MGAAGDDFWYSMKNPPYPSPVPSPARALPNEETTKQSNEDKQNPPDTKDGG